MTKSNDNGPSMTVRAVWLMCGRMLAFLFSFALPLLLVRRLSQHEFGVYKQVFLIVGTAMTTLPMGFGMSAFYFLPREQNRRSLIVLNILLFHWLIGILTFLALLFYPNLLVIIFKTSELRQYAPFVGLITMLWIVATLVEVIVVANQEPKMATLLIVVSQFSKAVFLLVAAVFFGSVWSLIYAALVQGVFQTLLLLLYLYSRFGVFWRSFSWSVMRMQLSYALPLGVAAFLFRIHSDLHNYFVSYRFGAEAYAIYAIGCFNFLLVDMLSDAVGSVMIPRVSYLQSIGNHREIIELTARMIRKLSAVFFPLYAFLLVTGRDVILVLFTSRYSASWRIFVVNLTIIPLTLLLAATDPIMRAFAEHRYFLLKIRLALLPLLFVALYFGTASFGLIGAILAVVGLNLVERIVTAVKAGNIVGAKIRDLALLNDTSKIAIAAIACGLLTYIAHSLLTHFRPIISVAVCGFVFAVCYLTALLVLGVLSVEEKEAIRYKLYMVRNLLWKSPAVHVPEN